MHRYLLHHDQLLEYIAGTLTTASGQGPGEKELEGIEFTNVPSTERAIYVYQGQLTYFTRHSKSKRSTGREFIVARFLPNCAGRILFLYLVYIRQFAELLCREQEASYLSDHLENSLLFQSLVSQQRWPTSRFHQLLAVATSKLWCHQISIAVAEKQVQVENDFFKFPSKNLIVSKAKCIM